MKVTITCEACGHVGDYEVDIREINVAEPVEDAQLRGFRPLPISEPVDEVS